MPISFLPPASFCSSVSCTACQVSQMVALVCGHPNMLQAWQVGCWRTGRWVAGRLAQLYAAEGQCCSWQGGCCTRSRHIKAGWLLRDADAAPTSKQGGRRCMMLMQPPCQGRVAAVGEQETLQLGMQAAHRLALLMQACKQTHKPSRFCGQSYTGCTLHAACRMQLHKAGYLYMSPSLILLCGTELPSNT